MVSRTKQRTTSPTRQTAEKLRNVKSGGRSKRSNQGQRPAPKLARTTFRTSREMDFFSEKELTNQTGHEIGEWPLVITKELIDNALDACENAGVPPEITVTADAISISVADNGPGLPADTLEGALDFTVRTSDKEAYVAPCRGAQGNALKTLIPMPWVVDPDHGRLIVEASGFRHAITCRADVDQRAIVDAPAEPRPTTGTMVRIEWSERNDNDGDVVWPFGDILPLFNSDVAQAFRTLVEGFAVFNPHATITLDWFGEQTTWAASNPDWQKWRPDKPTSIHWYGPADLERLIGAYIGHDRDQGADRLVSDFIAEFDGMSGSRKRSKVLGTSDLRRVTLSEFVVNARLDSVRIERLLKAMQAETRPVKSKNLGVIGKDHLQQHLLGMGIEPDSFQYSRKMSKDGMPCVVESAFGWKGEHSEDRRTIFSGANWSSAIKNPFRSFGSTREGLETVLSDMRATRSEPIIFVIHLAHPHVRYTDRGKSALVIGGAE